MIVNLNEPLLKDLKILYERLESNDDHNVMIKVGQGNFKAHSVILQARSESLRRIINNENTDDADLIKKDKGLAIFKKIITFEIHHISPDIFKECLKYIYTGEFSLQENGEFMFDLIVAADKLKLVDMIEYLQIQFLEKKTSWIKENLIKVFQTSRNRKFERLQTYCEYIIDEDPTLIFNSKAFSTLQKDILLNLIKRDDLSLPEVNVWRHIVRWGIEQSPPIMDTNVEKWGEKKIFLILKERIDVFIPHIRFFNIPSDEYHEDVRPYKDAIPKEKIEQLEKFYFVKGSPPPPDALPPRQPSKKDISVLKHKISESKPAESVPAGSLDKEVINSKVDAHNIRRKPSLAIPPKVPHQYKNAPSKVTPSPSENDNANC